MEFQLLQLIQGGIPEYVGECAVVIDKNDKYLDRNIAQKIKEILKNKDYYEPNLVKKRIDKIAKNYNSRIYYKNFCELMR